MSLGRLRAASAAQSEAFAQQITALEKKKKTDLKNMIASAKTKQNKKKLPVCLSKKQLFNSEAKQTDVLRDATVKFTAPPLPLVGFEQ